MTVAITRQDGIVLSAHIVYDQQISIHIIWSGLTFGDRHIVNISSLTGTNDFPVRAQHVSK